MIVKVKFIEIIWDNYQGGSGKPIIRDILIELADNTQLSDIESKVIDVLTIKGIQGTYNEGLKTYPYDRLLGVELLPLLNAL